MVFLLHWKVPCMCNVFGLTVFFFLFCFPTFQLPIEEKIRTIAQQVYGAADIELSAEAKDKIDYYSQQVRAAEACARPSFSSEHSLTGTTAVVAPGLRLTAHLHGQDPPVSVPHAWQERSAEWLCPAHQRRPRQHRCRLHLPTGGDGKYEWTNGLVTGRGYFDSKIYNLITLITSSLTNQFSEILGL